MSVRVQEVLHKYEVGAGAAAIRFITAAIAILALAVVFDLCAYRNLAARDAMDLAQVARNLAEGRGFTTSFIRPLSVYLLSSRSSDKQAGKAGALEARNHPDLANAPVYPAVLAAFMRLNPSGQPDLTGRENFSVFLPDLSIAIFNQVLLAITAWMLFLLAKALFDAPLAWACCTLFLLTEAFWRFTVSGLATTLLIMEFLGLIWAISRIELTARQNAPSESALVGWTVLAGFLVGVMAMTRYSFFCLIIPLLVVLATLPSSKRPILIIAAVGVFLAVSAPWVVRNYQISGTPFGTAGFAIMSGTAPFPEDQLERSLHPPIRQVETSDYWQKLLTNLHDLVKTDLWHLGTGGWVVAFFFISLLVPFRSGVLERIRLFLVLSILTLLFAQALGRTTLWTESPGINSENLLIVVAPATLMFGLSLFLLLRDQLNLQGPAARNLLWAFLYLVVGAPLLLTIIGRHESPLVYPPYYPPWIQQKAHAIPATGTNSGAIMSDIPWAVAWYGQRESIWLSLKYIDRVSPELRDDFNAVDHVVPVKALYLTAKTLKTLDIKALGVWSQAERPDADFELVQKMVTQLGQELIRENAKQETIDRLRQIYAVVQKNWLQGGGDDWDSFVLGIFVKKEVPTGFRLQRAIGGILPEIFLTELNERPTEKTIQ